MKAEPIRLKQEDASIDFDYSIPSEAASIPALRDQLLNRAKLAKAEMLKDQAEYAKDMKAHDYPVHAYGFNTDWKTVADTGQLLVSIDGERQFFINAYLMAPSYNLRRTVHQPHKHPANPLIVPD